MNDWVQFRHFRYLLAIVEHGGFRAAARRLHTSQPNLSVHARQFQETLGIQLFRRAKNGRIELTEAGVEFRSIAEAVLAARDEALAALIAIGRGQIHTPKLGCPPFADSESLSLECEFHVRELETARASQSPCPRRAPQNGVAAESMQDRLKSVGFVEAAHDSRSRS
jgi:hypothetical protein